jgi:hypothetical protein
MSKEQALVFFNTDGQQADWITWQRPLTAKACLDPNLI